MADVFIHPGRLHGTIEPPPAKSDAHRALIAAGLAGAGQGVTGLPEVMPDDLLATQRCLRALLDGQPLLDCGESGTTLRLLIPIAAALEPGRRAEKLCFVGRGRLPQRPLAEYRAILGGAGAELQFPAAGSLPLYLQGRLQPGTFRVPGHISSQYISGLLMALPLLSGPSRIVLTTPLESAPYVAMTLRTLASFGIAVDVLPDGYHIPGGQHYHPAAYCIEKDYSQAAFWLTAAYAGSTLELVGLPADTAQGDRAIVGLLDDFRRQRDEYRIDAAQIPDLVPILAAAAALTSAVTRILHAGRLRLKESDRLAATRQALADLGADIEEDDDGLVIRGGAFSRRDCREGRLPGGTADSYADHRIAMTLAIAALSTEHGVLLRHAEAVRKSYPTFFQDFQRLGGVVDELDLGTQS
ncbi:MAG: 3-phosphoshikimate 1-carboxyvinyltransferase [Clostridiaceae bacterium]|nr:3-phosphoshikimate 1-carboxyvinyltransferase [Clostridiaceae bacterium]